MHDTAFQIGSLAMNIYADLRTDSILEVGSQAVNGSLRDNALPTTRYVGIDIEEGDGVDIVVEPNKPFPLDDNSFDLVVASSVFEHDPLFWLTFLEMCRATNDGGYIYINAPSNGLVHRYPQDNWRFYPDSGKALALWAVSQGMAVTLVESFIAKREKDIWNDFVAVFRKGPITKAMPKVFLHEHVECTDVLTWKSKDILNPSERPEDLILLNQAAERARAAEDEAAGLKTQLAASEDQRQLQLAETGDIRSELNLRESELRQRQEEIEQTRSELMQVRSQIDGLRSELAIMHADKLKWEELKVQLEARFGAQQEMNASILVQLQRRELELAEKRLELAEGKNEYEAITAQLTAAEKDLQSSRDRLSKSERKIDELISSLSVAEYASRDLEQKLSAHFHETATLSQIILESQQATITESEKARRIRDLYEAICAQPRWWSILPRSRRSRLQKERLSRLGLFDAQSYVGKNPDVAAAGEDPLHHYLHHGLDEKRPI